MRREPSPCASIDELRPEIDGIDCELPARIGARVAEVVEGRIARYQRALAGARAR